MQITEVDLSIIKPYENNPRVISDEAIHKVSESIKKFGWQQPIVVDKDYNIIVGHTRYHASKRLGLTKVPVKIFEDLSPDKISAYRLLDNKLNELTEWEEVLLQSELREIQNSDDLENLLSIFEKTTKEIPKIENDFETFESDEGSYTMTDDFVSLSLVMTPEDKKYCINTLKSFMQDHNLDTMSNAILYILKEKI
jgi:ParB/RepB/Spo0J family partition protein